VIHHIDYRSKAEDRKKELKKLQERGLTKTKAARLRDAPIPTEACNFREKQQELFAARRKNQADAMEFLHQFRADDDFVLRTTRRSLGSKDNKYSATCRYPPSPSTLGREREPDARASVYSYAIYPMLTETIHGSAVKHDGTSNELSPLQPPTNPPDIIKNSICFNSAFEALELAAKEASRQPLPEEDYFENADHDDNQYLETAIGTLHTLVEHTDQLLIPDDNNGLGNSGEDESESKKCSTTFQSFAEEAAQASLPDSDNKNGCGHNFKRDITAAEIDDRKSNLVLILKSEVDEGNIPSHDSDCIVAVDSSNAPFIPYEAFSKLGESLVVESHSIPQSKDLHVGKSFTKYDSDDESIIPGESFMQLGASMMANDLFSSKDDDEEKSMLTKESLQYSIENSGLISTTATDVTASQTSSNSKSLSVDVEIVERVSDETLHPKNGESVKSACDDVIPERKAMAEDESTSLGSKFDEQKRRFCEDEEFASTDVSIPRDTDGESSIQNSKSVFQSESCCDNAKEQEAFEMSMNTAAVIGDTVYETIKTPKKSNLSVARRDNEDGNCVDRISDKGEKLQESEAQSIEFNREIASTHSIGDAPRNIRRNRAKKKKKDESYYPSSSLFVSRQFFAR